MKRLLRGIIDCGGISRDGLVSNYQKLRASKIEWVQAPDRRIFQFVGDFFAQELELPAFRTVSDSFAKIDDVEAVERLKDIKEASPHEDGNYRWLLRTLLDEQHKQALLATLKETQEIAVKGLTLGEGREKKRVEGVKEAILHLQHKVSSLAVEDATTKTKANLRAEAPEAWMDYEKAQASPDKAVGKLIGIPEVDTVCKGAKSGELWLHAGYTGELKTVVGLNWCYQLVTRYQTNVYFVSLEMPLKQLRNIICVMHTTNPKWDRMGFKPLEYRKVRDGGLSPDEAAFYKLALDDFYTNPSYGQFEVWCPDHEVNINDIKAAAEFHSKNLDLGFLVIDHGGIVQPVQEYKDFNIALNTVIRDAKRVALHFNQGAGIAVLLLFQINRQGKDDADKNEGRYKLRALSNANEAERSADVVTTTYLNDELRRQGRTIVCNLKNRDNPLFEPFHLGVDFATRRLTKAVDAGEGAVSTPGEVEAILAAV